MVATGSVAGKAADGPISASDALGADVERVKTGLSSWDRLLGGGPAVGSTLLLFGVPGAGKSSEALRLAGAVAQATNARALVLSSEMPPPLLASYCARLGVPLERVDLWHGHAWRRARASLSPVYRAIVVDSLQPYARSADAIKGVLADLEAASRAVRIVVARVNKRGEPSGVRDLDHDVDAVARVLKRTIQLTKSRFCDAPKETRRDARSESVARRGSAPQRSDRRPPLRLVE